MSKFVAGHVTKMWFFKIMHLNFKDNVEKMM